MSIEEGKEIREQVVIGQYLVESLKKKKKVNSIIINVLLCVKFRIGTYSNMLTDIMLTDINNISINRVLLFVVLLQGDDVNYNWIVSQLKNKNMSVS